MLKFSFPLLLLFLLFAKILRDLNPRCPGCGISHNYSLPSPSTFLLWQNLSFLLGRISQQLLTSLKYWCLTYSTVFILKNTWIQQFIVWRPVTRPHELLSYPQLLLAVISPCLFFSIFPCTFLLCHASIFTLHCFLLHAFRHITFPPSSWIWLFIALRS